jgi:hypothetical protein
MNDQLHIDPVTLIDEVVRYLTVMDAFRAAGCEPFWRPECGAIAIDFEQLGDKAPTVSAR